MSIISVAWLSLIVLLLLVWIFSGKCYPNTVRNGYSSRTTQQRINNTILNGNILVNRVDNSRDRLVRTNTKRIYETKESRIDINSSTFIVSRNHTDLSTTISTSISTNKLLRSRRLLRSILEQECTIPTVRLILRILNRTFCYMNI
jgi:hypothetical protein